MLYKRLQHPNTISTESYSPLNQHSPLSVYQGLKLTEVWGRMPPKATKLFTILGRKLINTAK